LLKKEELHNTIEYHSKSRLQPTTLAIDIPTTYEVDKNNKATMHNIPAQNQQMIANVNKLSSNLDYVYEMCWIHVGMMVMYFVS
jgi:cell division protein FtsB